MLLLHLANHLTRYQVSQTNRLRTVPPSQLHHHLASRRKRYLVTDRNENVLVLILIDQHCFTPFLSRFALYRHTLTLNVQLISQPLLNLALMKPIDIEKSFSTSNRWNIQQHSQMTSISTLIFMQYAVSVDQNHLRPQIRPVLLEFLKEMQSWRQFSESQKSRNVLLLQDNIHKILVDNLLSLYRINHKSRTSTVLELTRKTHIHTSHQLQLIQLPVKLIHHGDFITNKSLLATPQLSLSLRHHRSLLMIVQLHY